MIIDKNKNYGEIVTLNIRTEKEIENELIKKLKSLIIAGYNNKEILNKIENIDNKKINEIRNNLFK